MSVGSHSLVQAAAEAIDRAGLPPGQLTTEAPDSYAFANRRAAAELMTKPRLLGCGLAIDDIGMGHSFTPPIPENRLLPLVTQFPYWRAPQVIAKDNNLGTAYP